MTMQKMTGGTPAHEVSVSEDVLTIGSDTTIDKLHNKLGSMWVYYINQRVWGNPVLLTSFFGEYQAYTGTYSEFVNKLRLDTAEAIATETNRIYKDFPDKPVTFTDGMIRRTTRALESKANYHESSLSSYNKNVNAMQTLIRQYGDEAKIMAGNAT